MCQTGLLTKRVFWAHERGRLSLSDVNGEIQEVGDNVAEWRGPLRKGMSKRLKEGVGINLCVNKFLIAPGQQTWRCTLLSHFVPCFIVTSLYCTHRLSLYPRTSWPSQNKIFKPCQHIYKCAFVYMLTLNLNTICSMCSLGWSLTLFFLLIHETIGKCLL